jgi:hypothetical protein
MIFASVAMIGAQKAVITGYVSDAGSIEASDISDKNVLLTAEIRDNFSSQR